MKSILSISLILLGLSVFGQTTKKQPYIFDNYVTLNDSLRIGTSSNMFQYGEFLKVDTLPSGVPFISTGAGSSSSLPYDSITSAPFKLAPNGWQTSVGADVFSFGVLNDTTTASIYAQRGIQRGVYQMESDETTIRGAESDIFYVGQNTAPTPITSFSDMQEGRIITIIGWDSGVNTSEITSSPNIILTGADPFPLRDNEHITLICVRRNGGSGDLILLELHRQ